MKLVANETLDLTATTFRTEAEKIVAAHPDAIMTEALGSADPTLFAEIKQLNGGKMIPIIGTSAAISPAFYSACAKAVGGADVRGQLPRRQPGRRDQGPAYQAFARHCWRSRARSAAPTGNFTTYFTAPGAVHLYDGMNLAALAMVAAHSTEVAKWRPFITAIGDGVPGAVVVNSFARASPRSRPARRSATGPWRARPTSTPTMTRPGMFQIDTYSATGAVKVSGNISAAQLRGQPVIGL